MKFKATLTETHVREIYFEADNRDQAYEKMVMRESMNRYQHRPEQFILSETKEEVKLSEIREADYKDAQERWEKQNLPVEAFRQAPVLSEPTPEAKL